MDLRDHGQPVDRFAPHPYPAPPAPALAPVPFPPAHLHAPLIPWDEDEIAACLAAWASAAAAHRQRAAKRSNAGRNDRMWRLYHDEGLTAEEIGRLFGLTTSGVYAAIKRMRPDYGGQRKPSSGQRPPDYNRLVARVLALRDSEQMSETEIMTALNMPRVMVAAILREDQP